MTTPAATRPTACCSALCSALLLTALGCYNGDEMVERVRNDAIRTRLEEIELGEFHVTLPPDQQSNEMTEVFIDVYGSAVRYRLDHIREAMQENEHIYRQEVLLSIRGATNEELADPELTELRERLLAAINKNLGDSPVDSIGFRNLRIVRH